MHYGLSDGVAHIYYVFKHRRPLLESESIKLPLLPPSKKKMGAHFPWSPSSSPHAASGWIEKDFATRSAGGPPARPARC